MDYPYICQTVYTMRRIRRTGLFLLLLATVILTLYLAMPPFLALDRPVDSRNVLVEAWVPASEMENAVRTLAQDPGIDFFVVGRAYPPFHPDDLPPWPSGEASGKEDARAGVWLYANSSLEFRLPGSVTAVLKDTVTLVLSVRGQAASGFGAHFRLVVNGRAVMGGFAGEDPEEQSCTWISHGEPMRSVFVRFNNDLKADTADRNLMVLALVIDGNRIVANQATTRITRDMNSGTTGFRSQAAETADYLVGIGISPGRVHAVDFHAPERNLTLASAHAFREYSGNTGIGSFNVVSSGLHCRRTWLSYRKTFGGEARVGVLNFHPNGYTRKSEFGNRPFALSLADEFISYVLVWSGIAI